MTDSSSTRAAPSRTPPARAATAAIVTATAALALVVFALPAPKAHAETAPATPPPTSPSSSPSTSPPSPSPSPPAPASPPATASGMAVEQITGIPKVVPPGGTIHPTLEITQTTPYTLTVVPAPLLNVATGKATSSQQDITVRMQNPVTGQWVNGEQEAVAWGTGVELNFHFGDQFALPPGGKLVLPFEVVFGPAAPLTEYYPEFGAVIRVRDWPSTFINQEVSGWGDEVAFLLGTVPPPQQGRVDPYELGGGGAPAGAGPAAAGPSPAAPGAVMSSGTPGQPSPVPAPTMDVSQDPQIEADRVAMYRTRELPSVAGAVLVSWLLLLGGYLRRVRGRRDAVQLADRER